MQFKWKLLRVCAISAVLISCISVVNADDSIEVNSNTNRIAVSSAMADVHPKAEDDNTVMSGRMFISKAEQDAVNIDVSSMLTDESWKEIEDTEIVIDGEKVKTYKQSMIDSFVNAETQKKLEELRNAYPDATYDDYGKLIVDSYETAAGLDIRTKSNWTLEDFQLVCSNSEIQDLLPVALRIEEETGTNALYLVSVAICETGWGKHMAGSYNYFNWSSHGVQSFSSIEDFADYSVDRYASKYTKESTYGVSLITPRVVNKIYAINGDGSVNWNWSEHVCSMMAQLSKARLNSST